MALSFPYTLADFTDVMTYENVTIGMRRFDEMSGSGDGRYWSAQLAAPLWYSEVPLGTRAHAAARAINAKIHALDGMRRQFLFSDPSYTGPAAGNTGLTGVTISAISPDRDRLAITGLPSGFKIATGEPFSIVYGSGRYFYGEWLEDRTATGAGYIASVEIRPYLPLSIAVGATIELVRPLFKAMIETYSPYQFFAGDIASGASITLLQKP